MSKTKQERRLAGLNLKELAEDSGQSEAKHVSDFVDDLMADGAKPDDIINSLEEMSSWIEDFKAAWNK